MKLTNITLTILVGLALCASSPALASIHTGLLTHLDFNETSGSVAGNSGSAGDGSLVSFPTNDSQWLGGSLAFNNSSNYVNVPGGAATSSSFTISAIVTPNSTSNMGIMMAYASAGSFDRMLFVENGKFVFFFNDDAGAPQNWFKGTTNVVPGVTYNLIGVADSNGTGSLYVNGVQEASMAIGTPGNSLSLLRVGERTNGNSGSGDGGGGNFPASRFNGSIDEVRVYDRALSGVVDGNGVLTGGDLFVLNGGADVPEPTTLAIWSLLATLGLCVGWRRRRRTA